MKKLRVGIMGCGSISRKYLRAATPFPHLQWVACADLDRTQAETLAAEFAIPRVCDTARLPSLEEVEAVLNLTVPSAHAEVSLAALRAGKHVYSEKPLAIRRRDAREILGLAKDKRLRVGCAPDTFLGAGIQTCRKLLDEGAIGKPLAACAFMMSRGVESWHPNPDFFYKKGGGPLFDMGPYYLTAMVALLGPVCRVTGMASTGIAERLITSLPRAGQKVVVETPTHVAACLEFVSGVLATLVTSFEVSAHQCPRLEIYGEEGTLEVPDPNTFGGPVRLWQRREGCWKEAPLEFPYRTESRGLGLAEMALAIEEEREHRASGTLAFHILDIMHSILDAAEDGRHIELRSSAHRPAPMPNQPLFPPGEALA